MTSVVAICLTLGGLQPHPAHAIVDDLFFVNSVTGTYLLTQENGFKRIVTITADENFFSVSQESPSFGFSDGQGAWKRLGQQRKITAKVLDFDFNTRTGAPLSVSRVTFTLTFEERVNGKFQQVSGEFLVEQFRLKENPLDPDITPYQTFGPTSVTGERINAD